MIPLAKSEDPKNYKHALEVAKKNLIQKDPFKVEKNAGVKWDGEKYIVKSLNDELKVYPKEGKVYLSSQEKLVVFTLQLICINYLARAGGENLTYNNISYRELPGAESYWLAFNREAISPLLKAYEKDKTSFSDVCSMLGGIKQEGKADYSAIFWALPKVPVIINLWEGDDEIPGNCNILFDKVTPDYLHTEDVAALGQLIAEIIHKEV
ncbi:DUF3786 domain-containing protein [Natranaerofaba carboxydovora]|uniref:DUF3786 domain-containing protein n=1 Tax=Natranaerofaba carboxydovora TaxID=2742683 RepID=UPI001F13C6DF|nr:DUF3786 domain-containing protein [Natranaerofaba carboxydovora]UMZ75203.1 hypothetical protein ACONDI_02818 [Natranaerofaba carboxydovora]